MSKSVTEVGVVQIVAFSSDVYAPKEARDAPLRADAITITGG